MKRRAGRQPIATLPKATMAFTSFVSSLFSTVYADAPTEEQKAEETPEASEETTEQAAEGEEEEPEPEDVSCLRYFPTRYTNLHGPFSCNPRFEKNAKIVLNVLRPRNTICIARKR